MEIYVKPALERNLFDDSFQMQQVNLTWKATNYSGIYLDIQVDFTNISYISPNPYQDNLIIWINEKQ